MRNAAIAVLREIGVDTGGSNVQFAVNPADGRLVIIEMNPRVSRSSALASKATGFPIAKVAAKLAVGYTLDELDNEITGVTPASFEPTIDYVVTKMPRFTFEKFPGAEPLLTTSMKSVGEAMAIGRSFAESVQKALRSMETGLDRLRRGRDRGRREPASKERGPRGARQAVARPAADDRAGLPPRPHDRRDPRRLPIRSVVPRARSRDRRDRGARCGATGLPERCDRAAAAEADGLFRRAACRAGRRRARTRSRRCAQRLGVHPVYKRIDTCAAEFASLTPYMYSTYEGDGVSPAECEAEPTDRDKVVILGGGPNRIGQGIEFDYCCVHAAYSLARGRHRDDHGQLQPGDRLDRLRHLRPALFRAADRRGRDRDRAGRADARPAARGHRAVRRADAAQARQGARSARTSRSSAPRPTRSTSPRTGSASSSCCAGSGCASRDNGTAYSAEEAEAIAAAHRLSGGDPAVLCAGRAGDGDRPRQRRARPLHPQRGDASRAAARC